MHPAQWFGRRTPRPSTMSGLTKTTDPPASFGISWGRRWPRMCFLRASARRLPTRRQTILHERRLNTSCFRSILGDRLRHDVRLMTRHKRKSALQILGSPDELKFRSCLTLFRESASDKSDHSLFAEALEQFYDGKPDPRTRELLRCE
jgi:hypothetical protein